MLEEPDDTDLDALADKYRPKKSASPPANDEPKDTNSKPTGTILLEPIRPPTPPLEEIKVEPVKPTYVEVKKPLKRKYIYIDVENIRPITHNLGHQMSD